MPSTSVHFPVELLRRIDRTAKRRRVSRNRLITEACRSVVDAGQSEWPKTSSRPPTYADEISSSFVDLR